MTESYDTIELRRFTRRIGITGLRVPSEGDEEQSPLSMLRPFFGVLDTTVRRDHFRNPVPQLAYLTLAPFVTHELTEIQGRTETAETIKTAETVKTVETAERTEQEPIGSNDADESAAESKVRHILREQVRDHSIAEASGVDETREKTAFSSVLDTTVRQEHSHRTLPQLAYLTLAPLVTEELAETKGSAGRDGRTDWGPIPSNDADEMATEPKVRHILREGVRERSTDEAPGVDVPRKDIGGERTGPRGPEMTTIEQLGQDSQHEPPDTMPSSPDSGESTERQSKTDLEESLGVVEPPKTVVERSDITTQSILDEADAGDSDAVFDFAGPLRTVVERSDLTRRFPPEEVDIGGAAPLTPEIWPEPGSRESPITAGQPDATTPMMTVRNEYGEGRDERESGGSPFMLDAPDRGSGDIGHEGPGLTLKRVNRSQQASESTDSGHIEAQRQADTQAGWRAEIPPARSEPLAARTVFMEDGSVNDRVLDRLYEELTRKRRIERIREGR